MRRALRIILVFSGLLLVITPLSAQNSPIGLWEHYGLMYKKDGLLKNNARLLDAPFIEKTVVNITDDIVMNYDVFANLYHRPLSQLIDSEYFFYEEWTETTEITPISKIRPNNTTIDHNLFDKLYNKPPIDQKRKLREEWKKAFGGVDVWYPYFKSREIEDWVKERLSLKMGRLKGKPQFERGKILYVFKSRF